uniref:Patatin n=1 Tax=Chlamydomonas leiostraca TaxID=1034604 RepID=A0A7S0WTC8_9CHLO|mmetsp:Transcript_27528/g.70090  ORF Transcript_27528/g.70090 Transcript_27528/m.70090 type:complete len:372 (+) Transcript_27528:172-1287(+)
MACSARLSAAQRQAASRPSQARGVVSMRSISRRAKGRASVSARAYSQPVLAFQGASAASSVASVQSVDEATEAQKRQKLTVSWAGAGLYFFWQLGAMKYLAERYDLTKIPMAGASGGALAAVLAACGVPADRVMQHAYDLSVKHNIWERPLGLLGVWGSLIEKWLDDLLPDNAHELCRGRITVVVTTLPDMAQVGISDYTSKKDLIDACMASSHIPLLLDMRLTKRHRGRSCVDGSFPDFFTGLNSELLRCGGQAVIFDYWEDPGLQRQGRMDMLKLKSYDEIYRYYEVGYAYAERLHTAGKFAGYDLVEVLLQGRDGHMQERLVEHEAAAAAEDDPATSPPPQAVVLDLGQSPAQLRQEVAHAPAHAHRG